MLADIATGGSTKELFKQMEAGQLDPNILLPKLAAEMEKKARQGEARWRGTSGYQQGISEKAMEDNLKVFATSGGDAGFIKIWSTFAETLPKMRPLFIAAGQGFDFFAGKFQGLGDVIGAFSSIVGQIQKITSSTEDMSARVGQLAPFLAAFWKRAFAPIYGAYLIIQDIAGYSMGMKSVTGMAFDFMQGKTTPKGVPQLINKESNPYYGQALAVPAWEAKKAWEKNPTGWNTVKFGALDFANAITQLGVDAGTWMFSPLKSSNLTRLTPEAEARAMFEKLTFGGVGSEYRNGGLPNFDITINAQTNDPQELANIVTRTISNQAVPFLLRNNGE